MKLAKIISSATLALAIMGGAIALAPSQAEAAGGKFIDYGALKKGKAPGKQNPQPVNPWHRGCSASSRCKRT